MKSDQISISRECLVYHGCTVCARQAVGERRRRVLIITTTHSRNGALASVAGSHAHSPL
jgi:hypothetical protein